MIISRTGSSCSILSKPYSSCDACPVTTTSNAYKVAEARVIEDCSIDTVMILSDGAWRKIIYRNDIIQGALKNIMEKKYSELFEYLEAQNSYDDYSFIVMDISNANNGESVA